MKYYMIFTDPTCFDPDRKSGQAVKCSLEAKLQIPFQI